MTEPMLTVGKLTNTHGIKGEVRVQAFTDFPELRFAKGSQLYLTNPANPQRKEPLVLTVVRARRHKQGWILQFAGYDHINQVESWKGGLLHVPQSETPPLAEGEYMFHQIIGCRVKTEEGEELGKVREILTPGANDVWVVEREGKELLVPYIEDVVKAVDLERRTITIHPLPGLLEDEEKGW